MTCIGGDSQRETLELLELNGLQRDCLPIEYGGALDLSQAFSFWMQQRSTLEGATQPALLTAPPLLAAAVTSLSPASSSVSCSSVVGQVDSGLLVERLPNESKQDFVRRRNLIYGRRNAEKERRKVEDLENQHRSLLTRNQVLMRDNAFLETLLSQAQLLVLQLVNNNIHQ